MKATSQVRGCLLNKRDSGERFRLLHFMLETAGLQPVLLRRSRQGASLAEPDLFETGWLSLEYRSPGGIAFLREFEPEARFPGIARDYRVLESAARLSRFLERNLTHMESFEDTWRILQEALPAFAEKPHPQATLLKALVRVARSEGYPVLQSWQARLDPGDRPAVARLLKQPLDALDASPPRLGHWIRSFYRFLAEETDLLPPD